MLALKVPHDVIVWKGKHVLCEQLGLLGQQRRPVMTGDLIPEFVHQHHSLLDPAIGKTDAADSRTCSLYTVCKYPWSGLAEKSDRAPIGSQDSSTPGSRGFDRFESPITCSPQRIPPTRLSNDCQSRSLRMGRSYSAVPPPRKSWLCPN